MQNSLHDGTEPDDQGDKEEKRVTDEDAADSEEDEGELSLAESSQSDPTSLIEDVEEDNNDESLALPLDRPAKEFYNTLFESHDKYKHFKEGKDRAMVIFSGVCRRCGKTVHGQDSYNAYRLHFKSKHPPGTQGSSRVTVAPEDLPVTAAQRECFDVLFESKRRKKYREPGWERAKLRYSGKCRICGKTVSGLNNFAAFKNHAKTKQHLAAVAVLKGHGEGSSLSEIPPVDHVESSSPPKSTRLRTKFSKSSSALLAKADEPITSELITELLGHSCKMVYLRLFEDHDTVENTVFEDNMERNVKRYEAKCKLCKEVVTGIQSLEPFKWHFDKNHNDNPTESFTNPTRVTRSQKRRLEQESINKCSNGLPASMSESQDDVFSSWFLPNETDASGSVAGGKQFRGRTSPGVEMDASRESYPYTVTAKRKAAPSTAVVVHSVGNVSDNHIVQQMLNKNLTLCVAELLLSPSYFTSSSMKRLVTGLNQNVKLPSQQVLIGTHLIDLQLHIKRRILERLNTAPNFSLTVHLFPKKGCFVVIIHYVDSDWKLQSVPLACKPVSLQSTSQNILRDILMVVRDFAIKEKISFVDVIDFEGNSVPVGQLENEDIKMGSLNGGKILVDRVKKDIQEHFGANYCAITINRLVPILNAVLETAIKKHPTLTAVIKKCVVISENLITPLEGPDQELPWTTLLEIITKISVLNWKTCDLPTSQKLDAKQQFIAKELVEITKPFQEIFTKFQQLDPPSACDIIPFVYGMLYWLRKYENNLENVMAFVQDLISEVDTGFQGVDKSDLYVLAAVSDPKYKLAWCEWESSTRDSISVKGLVLEAISAESSEDTVGEATIVEPLPKRSALLSFMNIVSTSAAKISKELTAEEELAAYLDDEVTHVDPLEYWRHNKTRFKRLATHARKIFCVPAAGSSSRELLSMLGNKGTLLEAVDSSETLLFCHMNIALAHGYSEVA